MDNKQFRTIVKDKFNLKIKLTYFPNQQYLNYLIASINKVESNNYSNSHIGFLSEYKYLNHIDVVKSKKEFIDGCLNQLLWINSILESGDTARDAQELEEKFDYETPIMPGNPWTLEKVTNRGVFFRGSEPSQDSRVIINSENIIEILDALAKVDVDVYSLDDQINTGIKSHEVKAESFPIMSNKKETLKSHPQPRTMTEKEKTKEYCLQLLKGKLFAPKYK